MADLSDLKQARYDQNGNLITMQSQESRFVPLRNTRGQIQVSSPTKEDYLLSSTNQEGLNTQ